MPILKVKVTIPWKFTGSRKKIFESTVLDGTFNIEGPSGKSVWFKRMGQRWLCYCGRAKFFDSMTDLLVWADSFLE